MVGVSATEAEPEVEHVTVVWKFDEADPAVAPHGAADTGLAVDPIARIVTVNDNASRAALT